MIEILEALAPVSENLKNRILSIESFEDVMQLTVKAAKADTLQNFDEELAKAGY